MKFTHRQKVFGVAILLFLFGIGYYYYRSNEQPDDLTMYGNVDVRQVSVAFNASERIEQMFVEEGDRVYKGQILATLQTEALRLSIQQSKANIATQAAAVERLRNGSRPEEIQQAAAAQREALANYQNALITKQRMENLYSQAAISKQQLDDVDARYKSALGTLDKTEAAYSLVVAGPRSEDIKQAEAQLEALQAGLKIQEYNLSQTNLVAPVDGVIRSRLQEPGDMTTPQKPVYLLTVNTKKWVRVYASEVQLGYLKPGRHVKVMIDSFPNTTLDGTIGYISDVAEFTPKNVQTPELRSSLLYEVRVYVDDGQDVLRMGMPATVTVK